MAKGVRLAQPGLFDPPARRVELTALQQTKAATLLGTLLMEALAGRIDAAVIQLQEAGDDEDHG